VNLFGGRRRGSATATAGAAESRSLVGPELGLSDPALAAYMGIGGLNDAGVSVTETTALGSAAAYRSVRLIADTVAAMPMKSYRDDTDGRRESVKSIFDNPGGSLLTPYAWKQLVVTYMALHGAAPLLHIYNQAGGLDSFLPIHPSAVEVEYDQAAYGRRFKVTVGGRTSVYTESELTYVMAFSRDGIVGASPISLCRHAIGTGLAGDKAAARMFSSGMLIGGLVTPAEEIDPDQALEAMTDLKARISGVRNAGDLVMVNAALKVQAWTMSSEDAQFLETRQYGVEEIARIWGVPKELLSASGATSWGSGIQELVRGFARFTLPAYTTPLEEALSRLLSRRSAPGTLVEFEYAGLLKGTPADEIDLLIKQVDAGLLTVDEARAIRNMPPLPKKPAAPSADDSPGPPSEGDTDPSEEDTE
jgi:HK97 family phage portal protein